MSTQTDLQGRAPLWYQNISDLPLIRFVDVCVHDNLSALIITGFPSQIELKIAWDEIQQQYAEEMGDGETVLYISLYRDIVSLTIQMQEVEELINGKCGLRKMYTKVCADYLNDLVQGSFEFDFEDTDNYHKMLDGCENRAKAFKIDFDMKMIHFKSIQSKNEDEKQPYTRAYFQDILITLSDYSKYNMAENITVYEFCNRVKRYNKACKELENKKR